MGKTIWKKGIYCLKGGTSRLLNGIQSEVVVSSVFVSSTTGAGITIDIAIQQVIARNNILKFFFMVTQPPIEN